MLFCSMIWSLLLTLRDEDITELVNALTDYLRSNRGVIAPTSNAVEPRPKKRRTAEKIVDLYDYCEQYSSDIEQVRVGSSFVITKNLVQLLGCNFGSNVVKTKRVL